MLYSPLTSRQKEKMLDALGLTRIEALFSDIPSLSTATPLSGFSSESDIELMQKMGQLSAQNGVNTESSFLGAGAYDHFSPSVVRYLVSRSEFSTSYTPYQPEMSQGTLRAIFEFQTMVCELTGMDIANASVYDGASALAESCSLVYHFFQKQRPEVVVPSTLSPSYLEVLQTYLVPKGACVKVIEGGCHYAFDSVLFESAMTEKVCAIVLPYPDFFGTVHAYESTIKKAKELGIKVVFSCDPSALALLKSPGELGADVVAGEGQSLGIPLAYGGPYLGLMSAKQEFIRFFPGRIVGRTVDTQGKSGYVLTLQTREQHIRREKSYSSICTNQGLLALSATIYMALMGPHGLQEVALLCYKKSQYLKNEIGKIAGFKILNQGPTFKEFLVQVPCKLDRLSAYLKQKNIVGGVPLGEDSLLIAVTETKSVAELDAFVDALKEFQWK